MPAAPLAHNYATCPDVLARWRCQFCATEGQTKCGCAACDGSRGAGVYARVNVRMVIHVALASSAYERFKLKKPRHVQPEGQGHGTAGAQHVSVASVSFPEAAELAIVYVVL
jgi:hypothetical protein